MTEKAYDVHETVRAGYAKIAKSSETAASMSAGSCCGPASACGSSAPPVDEFATRMGYSEAEVSSLPDGTNMGLSCGNPTTLASLRSGDVVLDLGSGGGMDAFVAGPKVGATGRVIGVDMTPEMISKAR